MHLVPFLQEYLADVSLQQDNALCHVFKATHKFLKDNNTLLVKIRPESPDCNPIENLWHGLKHFMWTTVKPHNKEELIQGIKTFWATVTVCKYIDHLLKVIPKLLEVNGEAAGY